METSNEQPDGAKPSDSLIEIELQFTSCGIWFKADVTSEQYVSVMNTGVLEGKSVFAVSVFSLGTDLTYVYDFGRLHPEGKATWRVE